MQIKILTLILIMNSMFIFSDNPCMATDFDDGIAIDEKIDDTIKCQGMNTRFITLNAKQKAISGTVALEAGSDAENAVLNGVVVGTGAEVNGDIIIIDESGGDTTLVVD